MITCAIGVMAKTPHAGRSKTRLCPPLLPEQAAELSGAFLRDTLENVTIAAGKSPIVSYAAYAPQGSEEDLKTYLNKTTKLLLADGSPPMPEGVEGFGKCLLHAMQNMFAAGHAAACVLSSDCPTLPTRLLQQAADILLRPGHHGVFGACRDGGYYLLGLKSAHANLFKNVSWSTSLVADETRERAREISLELIELEDWYDVDDASSLKLLLEDREGYQAPRTKDVIQRLDLQTLLRPRSLSGAAK